MITSNRVGWHNLTLPEISALATLLNCYPELNQALNIALSYIAIVQPKVCYGNPTLGVFSSLPALIAGSACCGPIILLVLGIQASVSLIALFGVLVPIAIMLLLGTLVLNGRRTNVHYLREL